MGIPRETEEQRVNPYQAPIDELCPAKRQIWSDLKEDPLFLMAMPTILFLVVLDSWVIYILVIALQYAGYWR